MTYYVCFDKGPVASDGIMLYQVERLTYWLGHHSATIQAAAALVMVAITAVLCWVTHQYMVLTRELARIGSEQLKATLRPSIGVSFDFGGAQNSSGEDIFQDRLSISIHNIGSMPIIVEKAIVGWEHSQERGYVNAEITNFRSTVITADNKAVGELRTIIDGAAPKVEHFDSWSDFVSVEVHC